MAFYHYVAIFRCRSLKFPFQKVIVKPVTIELLSGPIEFDIPNQVSRVIVSGKGGHIAASEKMHLPSGENYLVIKAQIKDVDIGKVERLLDETITTISVLHQPHFFSSKYTVGH